MLARPIFALPRGVLRLPKVACSSQFTTQYSASPLFRRTYVTAKDEDGNRIFLSTDKQRHQAQESMRRYRANLTPEQREAARAQAREYKNTKRRTMDPEEMAALRDAEREWEAKRRARMTEEELVIYKAEKVACQRRRMERLREEKGDDSPRPVRMSKEAKRAMAEQAGEQMRMPGRPKKSETKKVEREKKEVKEAKELPPRTIEQERVGAIIAARLQRIDERRTAEVQPRSKDSVAVKVKRAEIIARAKLESQQ